MEHNRELAAQLAATIKAEPKLCWRNSVLALAAYNGNEVAHYVEGVIFIWDGSLQIDHGWLEIGGKLVDVTLDDERAEDYYPYLRMNFDQVREQVRKRKTLPYYLGKTEWRAGMRTFAYELQVKFRQPSEETT